MPNLLGVDTGGTYTDAVIVDEASGRVIAKAKAATTHDDLSVGIGGAIDAVLSAGVTAASIDLVSLSTTLATNALVEDQGRRAGLVLIGFDDDAAERGGLGSAAADDVLILVAGGHGSHGDEATALDLAALTAAVDSAAGHVHAFAVTAQFSVRNPAHEIAARELIVERTGLPVTCSHELSASLNGPRRALTSLLNARLIPMIGDLVASAQTILDARGIEAPVMIVRGNGSLVAASFVRDRPIETILSGPAASLRGAAHLTQTGDAVVADVGGTTTDIAVFRDGRLELSPDGASVGGHQTMVEAVMMHTHGLGGDSQVALAGHAVGAQLCLGPRRVVPLSRLAGTAADAVDSMLSRQLGADIPGEFDGIMLIPVQAPWFGADLTSAETDVLERVSMPVAMDRLVSRRIEVRAVARLVERGLLSQAGFTPTDAAHVLGLQSDLDTDVATKTAALFARRRDRFGRPIAPDADTVSGVVVDTLVRRSAEAVLAASLAADGVPAEAARSNLVSTSFDKKPGITRVDIGLGVPLVAVGAPATSYYPGVAQLLGTEASVPTHAEVANAVGAAVAHVEIRRSVLVSAPRRGVFRVHTDDEPVTLHDLAQAKRLAEETATARALHDGQRAGARNVSVSGDWVERSATIEDRPYFVEGTWTATASGRPALST
jgi:N-methylhydantoinase A/oxoprolinase/acetone carboxylase beta subunit